MSTPKNLNKLEIIDTATGKSTDITEHLHLDGYMKEYKKQFPTQESYDKEYLGNWEDEGGSIDYPPEELSEEDISDMIENDSIGG